MGGGTSQLYHKRLSHSIPFLARRVSNVNDEQLGNFSDDKTNVAISAALSWCLKPDCSKLILLLICRWQILSCFGSFHRRNEKMFFCGFGLEENINLLFGFDKGNLTKRRAIVSFVCFLPLFVAWLEIC